MTHEELVALIRDGVQDAGGTWADLGAGSGNFTFALRDLLGSHSTLYAVDRDAGAIHQLEQRIARSGAGAAIHPLRADFTKQLDLPPLDGILMANALHFTRNQVSLLSQLKTYLRAGAQLLIVEYDVRLPRPWIPFPLSWQRFPAVVTGAGFEAPTLVNTRRSPSSGVVMYAATAHLTTDD